MRVGLRGDDAVSLQLLSGPVRAIPLADALVTEGGIGAELAADDDSGSPLPPGVEINPSDPYGGGGSSGPYGGDDGGVETWVIIVIIAAVVAVVAMIVAFFVFRRRSDARNAAAADQKAGPYPYPPHGPPYAPPYGAPYAPPYAPGGYLHGHPGGYGQPPWPGYAPTPGLQREPSDGVHAKLQAVPGSPGAASTQSRSSVPGSRVSRVGAYPARWHAPFGAADVTFTDDFAMPQYTDVSPYHTIEDTVMTRATEASHTSRASRASQRTRVSARSTASGAGRGDPGQPVGPLPADASVPQLMERLSRQLDGMHAVGKPIMERFLLRGDSHRRMGGACSRCSPCMRPMHETQCLTMRLCAGQGVVQFARDVRDEREYAIKLFVSRKAFDSETALYGDEVLRELLPKIEVMTDNERSVEGDAHNIALPPFIVMEKGEALDEWSRRAKPDMFQSVAVRVPMHVHLALRVLRPVLRT